MIWIDLNSLEGSQKFKTQGLEEKSKKCEKKACSQVQETL